LFHKPFISLAATSAIGLLLTGTHLAGAAVLTFDDITTEDPTEEPVPEQTGGFDFGPGQFSLITDSEYTDPSGFNNSYGSPSGEYAAFNSDGIDFLLISRDTRFNFTGADFTSFAKDDQFQDDSARTITLRGFRGELIAGEVTAPLSSDNYEFVSANFEDIDQVAFISSSVDPQTSPDAFYVFDNFTFAEVPEPGAGLALAAFGLAVFGRRRARNG